MYYFSISVKEYIRWLWPPRMKETFNLFIILFFFLFLLTIKIGNIVNTILLDIFYQVYVVNHVLKASKHLQIGKNGILKRKKM